MAPRHDTTKGPGPSLMGRLAVIGRAAAVVFVAMAGCLVLLLALQPSPALLPLPTEVPELPGPEGAAVVPLPADESDIEPERAVGTDSVQQTLSPLPVAAGQPGDSSTLPAAAGPSTTSPAAPAAEPIPDSGAEPAQGGDEPQASIRRPLVNVIYSTFDRRGLTKARRLAGQLHVEGFSVAMLWGRPLRLRASSVRYYHERDRIRANEIKRIVSEVPAVRDEVTIEPADGQDETPVPGVIEIWLGAS